MRQTQKGGGHHTRTKSSKTEEVIQKRRNDVRGQPHKRNIMTVYPERDHHDERTKTGPTGGETSEAWRISSKGGQKGGDPHSGRTREDERTGPDDGERSSKEIGRTASCVTTCAGSAKRHRGAMAKDNSSREFSRGGVLKECDFTRVTQQPDRPKWNETMIS